MVDARHGVRVKGEAKHNMETSALRFTCKKDFKIKIGLNPGDPVAESEFMDAIYRVVPSMKHPQLLLEVYQPLVGCVHDTVLQICNHGLRYCGVYTLVAGRPDLNDQEDCGHLKWLYEDGEVIEHHMPLSRDIVDGDDFLVHMLCIDFARCDIGSKEFTGPQQRERPSFQIVRDCGSSIGA